MKYSVDQSMMNQSVNLSIDHITILFQFYSMKQKSIDSTHISIDSFGQREEREREILLVESFLQHSLHHFLLKELDELISLNVKTFSRLFIYKNILLLLCFRMNFFFFYEKRKFIKNKMRMFSVSN